QPVFFSARFRVDDIRAVALAQPVVSKTAGGNAIVIVGTTLRGRDRLVTDLWLNSVRDQALLVGLAALLALFGLRRGLGPLLGLRKELAERRPGSLQPVETAHLQSELRPLIGALNHAFGRIERYVALQRRFV
ncbi:sensor histidine kinase N-terminal domain-containing protein, partial [Cupriavidus sp. 2MCAB6]